MINVKNYNTLQNLPSKNHRVSSLLRPTSLCFRTLGLIGQKPGLSTGSGLREILSQKPSWLYTSMLTQEAEAAEALSVMRLLPVGGCVVGEGKETKLGSNTTVY